MDNQIRNCGTCKAFEPTNSVSNGGRGCSAESDVGECRKNPISFHGFPKTEKKKWCLSGWEKSDRVSASNLTFNTSSLPDCTSLQFNFHYIKMYPNKAKLWLKNVLTGATNAIPECVQKLLADPFTISTSMSSDACEDVFQWAGQFDGFSLNTKDDDEYIGLIIYSDVASDVELSDKAKPLVGADHPWVIAAQNARTIEAGARLEKSNDNG